MLAVVSGRERLFFDGGQRTLPADLGPELPHHALLLSTHRAGDMVFPLVGSRIGFIDFRTVVGGRGGRDLLTAALVTRQSLSCQGQEVAFPTQPITVHLVKTEQHNGPAASILRRTGRSDIQHATAKYLLEFLRGLVDLAPQSSHIPNHRIDVFLGEVNRVFTTWLYHQDRAGIAVDHPPDGVFDYRGFESLCRRHDHHTIDRGVRSRVHRLDLVGPGFPLTRLRSPLRTDYPVLVRPLRHRNTGGRGQDGRHVEQYRGHAGRFHAVAFPAAKASSPMASSHSLSRPSRACSKVQPLWSPSPSTACLPVRFCQRVTMTSQ